MRLTTFSDYALRVLLYAGSVEGGKLVTIAETAAAYGISTAHLKKVVMHLTHAGYLHGARGRTGGYRLALPADQINLGALIRSTEADFALVQCFQKKGTCCIASPCRIPPILARATAAFLDVLDRHTLADVLIDQSLFSRAAAGQSAARTPEDASGVPRR